MDSIAIAHNEKIIIIIIELSLVKQKRRAKHLWLLFKLILEPKILDNPFLNSQMAII